MQPVAENCRDRQGAEHGAQTVDLLGGVVGAAQRIARLDLAEEPTDFPDAMMDRAWKCLVEQQRPPGDVGRLTIKEAAAMPSAIGENLAKKKLAASELVLCMGGQPDAHPQYYDDRRRLRL